MDQCAVDGNALYFSRAQIPWGRDGGFGAMKTLRHVGLYAYRARFLGDIVLLMLRSWSRLRTFVQMLEQLRVLYYGAKIHVLVTESALSLGVDTEEDLKKIRKLMPQTLE